MRISIDPGHGGHDSGAVAGETTEKALNLTLALALAAALQRRGHTAVLTRGADHYVELYNRAHICGEADAAISLHHNSAGPQARGYEILVHQGEDLILSAGQLKLAERVAAAIAQAMAAWGIPPRKPLIKGAWEWAHKKRLTVLAECAAPICLLEVGFISNEHDLATVTNPEFVREIAEALALGLTAEGEGDAARTADIGDESPGDC
jgi:N-acetylmuramoyl-L-alanine amidase